MTTNTTITTSNFTAKLSAWTKSATSMRQAAQDIIDFGLSVYAECGDTGYLSRLYQAAQQIRGINATKMRDYIKSRANVVTAQTADKSWVFKKAKAGTAPIVTESLEVWWEHGTKSPATTERVLSVKSRIDRLVKDITEAESVDVTEAEKVMAELKAAIEKAKAKAKA